MELEAVDEGVLGRILVPAGQRDIAVNTPICLLLAEGEEETALEQPLPPVHGPVTPARPEPPVPAVVDAERQPGETRLQTVREALRDAMAEEMLADERVFVMGEEVAEYQGAYKVTQGLLQQFGDRRVIDTPITEPGSPVSESGALWWPEAGRRIHDLQFRHAGNGSHHQLRRQDAVHVGRPDGMSDRLPRPERRGGTRCCPAFAGLFELVCPLPGPQGGRTLVRRRCQGLLKSAIRDPNPVIVLENEVLYGRSFEVPVDPDFVVPIGKAHVVGPGSDVTITAFSIMVGKALEAADLLAADGIGAEVVDLRRCGAGYRHGRRVRAADQPDRLGGEGWPACGIGPELAARVMEEASTGSMRH